MRHYTWRVRARFSALAANAPSKPENSKVTDLRAHEAVHNRPLRCRFVLVKTRPTGGKLKYPRGKEKRHTQAKKSAECNRKPWLLSDSLCLACLDARAIVKIDSQRVRIEQQFRDTKNNAITKDPGAPELGAPRATPNGDLRFPEFHYPTAEPIATSASANWPLRS